MPGQCRISNLLSTLSTVFTRGATRPESFGTYFFIIFLSNSELEFLASWSAQTYDTGMCQMALLYRDKGIPEILGKWSLPPYLIAGRPDYRKNPLLSRINRPLGCAIGITRAPH